MKSGGRVASRYYLPRASAARVEGIWTLALKKGVSPFLPPFYRRSMQKSAEPDENRKIKRGEKASSELVRSMCFIAAMLAVVGRGEGGMLSRFYKRSERSFFLHSQNDFSNYFLCV